jgi:hypothetical protein
VNIIIQDFPTLRPYFNEKSLHIVQNLANWSRNYIIPTRKPFTYEHLPIHHEK